MSKGIVFGTLAVAGAVIAGSLFLYNHDFGPGVALHLDQEEQTVDGKLMNPATQSINRYSSVLRDLNRLLEVELSDGGKKVSFTLGTMQGEDRLFANAIESKFLVPLLPYPTGGKPDAFDQANLMLAEFARNGIALSYQDENSMFGYFNATEGLFEENTEDYRYMNGQMSPNERTKPRRFSVTNNCLKPGLWEFAAKDTVGELYHSWFDMPREAYHQMIRGASDIQITDSDLADALSYDADISDVPLVLERLRREGKTLGSVQPRIRMSKEVGGYSSQDSRRKVQKGYFQVIRDGEVIEPKTFAEMKPGDVFRVRRFIAPGIYAAEDFEEFTYNPYWSKAQIREVTPLTRYPGGREADDPLGYVEIQLYESGGKRSIVVGNLPVSLLVEQDDYRIHAFGAGVLPPSEVVERRYLRIKEGPVPHYAYLITRDANRADEPWHLLNNHEFGLEQVYIRPFRRSGKMFLRLTLVSYERIVDLLEMELEVPEELAGRIRQATRDYVPPLFRVYEDANII